MEDCVVHFSGRVHSLSKTTDELTDTSIFYRVLYIDTKNAEEVAFRCKTTVFESNVSVSDDPSYFQWKDEFHFEIMGFPRKVSSYEDKKYPIPSPLHGELIIAFYRVISRGNNTFLGSLHIPLEDFEHLSMKKEEFVVNHVHHTSLSGTLPMNSNESELTEISLEISWYQEDNFEHISNFERVCSGEYVEDEANTGQDRIKAVAYDSNYEKRFNGDIVRYREVKGLQRESRSTQAKRLSVGELRSSIDKPDIKKLNGLQYFEAWNLFANLAVETSVCKSESADLQNGLLRINNLNEKHGVSLERATVVPNLLANKKTRPSAFPMKSIDYASVIDIVGLIPLVFCKSVVETVSEYMNTYDLHHALSLRISGVSEIFTETDDALSSNDINCLLKLRNSIDYIRECKCRSYRSLKFISADGQLDLQSLRESVQTLFSTIKRELLINETLKKVLLDVKSRYGHLYTKKKKIQAR